MIPGRRLIPTLAGLLGTLALLPGCGGSASSAYMPSDSVARQSLDAALGAWKAGKAPGLVAGTTPPVQVVDSSWSRGQTIAGYTVAEPESSGAGFQRFVVKLKVNDPKAPGKTREAEATYVVYGRDPVWVYRDEDFARALNMDNNPPAAPARRGRR